MKFLSTLLLFVLLTAWSYPTVSVLVNQLDDNTELFDYAEEEKEIEAECKLFTFHAHDFEYKVNAQISSRKSAILFNEFKRTHVLISLAVTVPPPKFI